MALNYVTLTLDGFDGSGAALGQGAATFTPSVQLSDPTDQEWIPPAPVQAVFRSGLPAPTVTLLATDNANVTPAGWGWTVSFQNVPGNPASFSFFLPFANGAAQRLSQLQPVQSVTTMQAYMPLPSGTPSSGQVPVATGIGGASEWAAAPGLIPSGDPTGTSDAAAIADAVAALPAPGGRILLNAGSWYVKTDQVQVTVNGPVYIDGPGKGACTVYAVGSGKCISMHDTTYPADGETFYGGGVRGITFDGTHASPGATGLDIGDGEGWELDVGVQNFTGAGSTGCRIANETWWTEKLSGLILAANCTSHVVFDVAGATTSTNSFGYDDLLIITEASAAQDGVVFQNGAYPYNGGLKIRGNFETSDTPMTTACVRITGTVPAGHPGAGAHSAIAWDVLDIKAEVNGTGAYAPQTIAAGDSSNGIFQCTGQINFMNGGSGADWAPSNLVPGVNFQFRGFAAGDANLATGGMPFPVLAWSYAVDDDGSTASVLISPLFSPAAGDIIVVKGVTDNAGSQTLGTPVDSASALTFTSQVSAADPGNCFAAIWTAQAQSAPGPITVSVTPSGGGNPHAMIIEVWSGAVLAASPATDAEHGSGVPSGCAITTAAADSIVTWVSGDFNAVDGASRKYVLTSGGPEETFYHLAPPAGSFYTVYSAWQPAFAAGAQHYGLTAPSGQQYQTAAIELQAAATAYRGG